MYTLSRKYRSTIVHFILFLEETTTKAKINESIRFVFANITLIVKQFHRIQPDSFFFSLFFFFKRYPLGAACNPGLNFRQSRTMDRARRWSRHFIA